MRKVCMFVLAIAIMVFNGCDKTITSEPTDSNNISPEPIASESVTPEPTDSATGTPEPTDSATGTPEPTARPKDKNYKLSGDSIILRSGLKISDLENYFELEGGKLLQKLGNEYEIVGAGVEETWDGYYFKKLGITLVFNDYDYSLEEAPLMWIDCDDDKLELNGLTPDMNFKQIQERIGNGEIVKEEFQEGTGEYEYDLTYIIGKVKLIFGSFTNDARNGYWVKIECN